MAKMTRYHQACDQASGCCGQDVAVVHPAPFIAARRGRQVIVTPVADADAAIPIVSLDASTLVPAVMAAIVVTIVAVVIAMHHHGFGAMVVMAVIPALRESAAHGRGQQSQGRGCNQKTLHGSLLSSFLCV